MTMRDDNIEIQLHALVDGELDADTARAIEARINADPALAARRNAILAAKAAMRRLPKPQPSEEFLKKISALANGEEKVVRPQFGKPAGIFSRSYSWQALAASVVLAALLGSGLTRIAMLNNTPDSFALALADDHRRSLLAVTPFDVASSDRHTVKPYLDAKLGLSPQAPDLTAQGFTLAGGRVEVVANKAVPALVYRHHEHLISLVAVPAQGGSPSEPVDVSAGGFSMVKWSDGAFSYWAISDTEWPDLNSFVSFFRAATAPK